MNKLLALVLVISIAMLGCAKKPVEDTTDSSANQTQELPAEAFEPQFESQEYGFRVKGPEGWLKEADSLGMLVTYLKPGNPDDFQENIMIAREAKPDAVDLQTYAAYNRDQVLETFAGAELKLEQDRTVGGLPGKQFRYVLEVEGRILEAEQVVVERATEFMLFTFMSSPESFALSYPKFVELLETVQFVGN